MKNVPTVGKLDVHSGRDCRFVEIHEYGEMKTMNAETKTRNNMRGEWL